MAQGKRILFVVEKLVALEVVKRRLDAAGLGEYYTGSNMNLVFINDDDHSSPGGSTWFKNALISEK